MTAHPARQPRPFIDRIERALLERDPNATS